MCDEAGIGVEFQQWKQGVHDYLSGGCDIVAKEKETKKEEHRMANQLQQV